MNSLTAYVVVLLGMTAMLLGAVVALELGRPDGYNTQALFTVLAIVGPLMGVALNAIKSHSNIQKVIEEVKGGT